MTDAPAVLAAGAVCWRVVGGKVRILLVSRTQHKDISLPKGKVDPGEGIRPILGYLAALAIGLIIVAVWPWLSTGFL